MEMTYCGKAWEEGDREKEGDRCKWQVKVEH